VKSFSARAARSLRSGESILENKSRADHGSLPAPLAQSILLIQENTSKTGNSQQKPEIRSYFYIIQRISGIGEGENQVCSFSGLWTLDSGLKRPVGRWTLDVGLI
jgi:hypothetical protein